MRRFLTGLAAVCLAVVMFAAAVVVYCYTALPQPTGERAGTAAFLAGSPFLVAGLFASLEALRRQQNGR